MRNSHALRGIRRTVLASLTAVASLALGAASSAHADEYFIRGDADTDGELTIGDPVSLLGCQFLGGRCSTCQSAADANASGAVDITDAVYVLNFLFLGGSSPPAPFPDCGPARGRTPAALGCASYAACDDPDRTPPPPVDPREETADPSVLHYAMRSTARSARVTHVEHDHDDDFVPVRVGSTRMPAGTARASVWNSVSGRRAASVVRVDPGLFRVLDPEYEFSDGLCVEPQFWYGSAGSSFKMGRTFYSIPGAFASDGHAYAWLESLKAEMPFFLPYRHPDVRLGQGWLYNNGDRHSSSDHSRIDVPVGEDPTFKVYSPAPGEVIYIGWRGGGNSVVIEHTAPSGLKYYTGVIHLRNGKEHDLAEALESSDDEYRAFAENHPDHISWGTNAHTLQVEVGDWVESGQLIGWAGNTGPGGANAGLDSDGNPTSHTGNVHLHWSMGVAHPTEPGAFINVDPYGVYEKASTGCYDGVVDTEFNRLVAPFYPSFHGLPLEVFLRYFSYYPGMGMGLRTLSLHRDGGQILASGSFDHGVDPVWACHVYMTAAELQDLWNVYWPQGMVIREMTAIPGAGGEPRFTAIWRAKRAGEGVEARANLTPSQWNDKWDELVVDAKWRVEDYFAYSVNGQERRASVFTSSEGRPFYFFPSLTSAGLSEKLEEFGAAGYVPVTLRAAELSHGTRYSVALRKMSGCWKVYWGATTAQYQQIANAEFAKDYRVEKVQGYANSSRYCAILYRDAQGGSCP